MASSTASSANSRSAVMLQVESHPQQKQIMRCKTYADMDLSRVVSCLALKVYGLDPRQAQASPQLLQRFQAEFSLRPVDQPELELDARSLPAAFGMHEDGKTYRLIVQSRKQQPEQQAAKKNTSGMVNIRVTRGEEKPARFAISDRAAFKKLFDSYQLKVNSRQTFVFMHGQLKLNNWHSPSEVGMLTDHDYVIQAMTMDEYESTHMPQLQTTAQKQRTASVISLDSTSDEDQDIQFMRQTAAPHSSAYKKARLMALSDDDVQVTSIKKPEIQYAMHPSGFFMSPTVPVKDINPVSQTSKFPQFQTALDGLQLGSKVSQDALNDKKQLLYQEYLRLQLAKKLGDDVKPGVDQKPKADYGITQEFGPDGHNVEDHAALANIETLISTYNVQYPPDQRMKTPTEMKIELKPYQLIGLSWMTHMERGETRGGMLCDSMGLGKSCQTIAAILANPPPARQDRQPVAEKQLSFQYDENFVQQEISSLRSKKVTTLIVLPLSLMDQWKSEFKKFVKSAHSLKILMFHNDYLSPSSRKQFERHPELLNDYDIVLCTYQSVALQFAWNKECLKEYNKGKFTLDRNDKSLGPFFKVHWWRIVLDEAHTIKNRSARSSIALSYLLSERRWCLTGTPIQNTSDDLYPLFRFLRIEPVSLFIYNFYIWQYRHWQRFKLDLSIDPKTRADRERVHGQEDARLHKLQAMLSCIMLRRTKDSRIDDSREPIVKLPAKDFIEYRPEFTASERELYDEFATKSLEKFREFQDELGKHYSHIFGMITKMRQMCLHYTLVTKGKTLEDELMNDELKVDRLICNLTRDVMNRIERILTGEDEMEECVICLQPVEAPIVTKCGHMYCIECIVDYIQSGGDEQPGDRSCPTCRQPLRRDELIPLRSIQKMVDPEQFEQDALEKAVTPNKYVKSTKITELMSILEKIQKEHPKDKAIVFCSFTSMLDLIQPALRQARKNYVRIDGTMKIRERADAIAKLNDPDTHLMLASLKAGCVGLNLTAANHVILLDLWWNPAIQNQAIDRIHRIGQMRDEVFVHTITIPNTIEDRIKILQEKKQQLSDNALGEGEGDGSAMRRNRLTRQDLIYLFTGGRSGR